MKYDKDADTAMFRSLPEHWNMERSGAKSNTIRALCSGDYIVLSGAERVRIVNTNTGESFTREISSITIVPGYVAAPADPEKYLVLISWWSR